MKSMLMHSFVLDALDTTGADTFSHFEMLIDEHRQMTNQLLDELSGETNTNITASTLSMHSALQPNMSIPSRLKQLIPSVGTFYTRLPLRKAFEAYNAKYGITKRRYICISFNEIRHILNLAQIIAMIHPYSDNTLTNYGRDGHSAGSLLVPDNHKIKNNNNNGKKKKKKKDGGKKVENVEGKKEEDTIIRIERQSTRDTRALEAWANMGNTPRSILNGDEKKNGKTEDDDSAAINITEEDHQTKSEEHRHKLEQRDRSDTNALEETLSLLPTQTTLPGPKLICFDGDQTLYTDGSNFDKSPKLARYLYLLLKHGVTIAVVTAAGYEYQSDKYELRLTGLLAYFQQRGLEREDLERFYIFGGECNYLLRLGTDYKLHAVREDGPGGWMISTKYISEAPGNWCDGEVASILDMAEISFHTSLQDQNMRARIIRKKRSVGLIPQVDEKIPREALDETVLRIQTELENTKVNLPFCAFNGGTDAWVDVGNKRVGVQVLQSYLGIPAEETLHIGDQFLNTGNDFAARSVCPCVWITSPEETTYILKSILRLAGVPLMALMENTPLAAASGDEKKEETVVIDGNRRKSQVDFAEAERRATLKMDVYTGEYIKM